MATKKFQIWETPDGAVMFESGKDISSHIDSNDIQHSKMVHELEATSWADAMQQRNDFFGFGPYKPMIDPSTGLPYIQDFAEFNSFDK